MLFQCQDGRICASSLRHDRSGQRADVSPEGFKSPTELLAVIFAPLGTPAGIDAQPGSASVKDLVESPILGRRRSMKPEAGQPTCFTVAG